MTSSHAPEDPNTEKSQKDITIPRGVTFDDLKLEMTNEGRLRFNLDIIEQVCKASDLPVEVITKGPESNLAGLLVTWYQKHLSQGGGHNSVMDSLLAPH